MVKDYKEIVLNYMKNHDIPSFLWLDLKHRLCKYVNVNQTMMYMN